MSEMEIHHQPSESPSDEGSPSAPPSASGAAHVPEEPAETDRPKIGVITLTIFATLALLGGLLIGVNEVFRQRMKSEVSHKVLAHANSELRELRAEEEAKLTRYQWVNKQKGVVRIPLPRAMELTLADYRAKSARNDVPAPTAPFAMGPQAAPNPAPAEPSLEAR
jgi:hypothetical protein